MENRKDYFMNRNDTPNNIIDLSRKLTERNRGPKTKTRVIAITSGKGGVGKTNIVANLGFSMTRMGKKVLILDADLGLGNLDILLGLTPRYNLSHVLAGSKSLEEIIMSGPGNMKILPASSGIQEHTHLSLDQKVRILTQLEAFAGTMDVMLIDTAAGISSNVMYFNTAAQEIMVVVSPEPTSITDAYALMKVLSMRHGEKQFKLIVNMVSSVREAKEVYRQLNLVAERFLDVSIAYAGCVLQDPKVTRCVMQQKVLCEHHPDSPAGKCFVSLARTICQSPVSKLPDGDSKFIWRDLLGNGRD